MRNCTKINEEFTLKNSTIFGGYNLFRDFLEKEEIFTKLDKHLSIKKAPNAKYHFAEVMGFLIEGYCIGLERIYHFQSIENDVLITKKNGLEKLPDYTLYQKDYLRIKEKNIAELKTVNRQTIKKYMPNKIVVLDFDSTVETTYGNFELATVGYNPIKRGRKSYHPSICSIRNNGLILNFQLRAGNAHSLTEFNNFLDETLSFIDENKKIINCLDSGYDDENIYNAYEARSIGYVTKLKMFDKTKVFSMKRKFKNIDMKKDSAQIAKMKMKRDKWSTSRRVVILRWKFNDDEPQGNFFDEFGYTYSAYVTNLDWEAVDIVRFYNARGGCENRIKECKQGLFINKFSSKLFLANYTDALLKIVAYNLLLIFQKKLLPKKDGYFSAATFRRMFFYVPAVLITSGRRLILKIKQEFPYQQEWNALHLKFAPP